MVKSLNIHHFSRLWIRKIVENTTSLVRILHKRSDLLSYVFLGIIVALYAYIEIRHFTTAYQEVDPDGYLILARRFASFGPLAVKDDDMFYYQTHVWVENQKGEVIPKFSPGYPLIMAIFYLFGGDGAMFIISPLCGALGLIGAYFLFRLWMSRFAALMGALCLATNKMYLIYTGYLLTHGTNICFVVWGMYFLWKWVREGSIRSGIGAGLLLGFAITVRHTSSLLVIVVITAVCSKLIEYYKLATSSKDSEESQTATNPTKAILVLLGCYSIFPLLLATYNWRFFGNPFISGYALSNEQFAFAWQQFRGNLATINRGLNYEALFLIFPAGIAGILVIAPFRESLMRIFWFLPIYFAYAAYYWAPSGMAYLRFLICTFPVFVGATFALLDKVPSPKAHKVFAMIVLPLFLITVRYTDTKNGMKGVVSDRGSRANANASRIASATLQKDAVIFSQSPVFCYIGTRRNFRFYDLRIFTKGYGNSTFRGGVRQQEKRAERFRQFYEQLNDAQLINKQRELVESSLSQKRQVAYLIPLNAKERERTQLGEDFKFELLKEWQMYPDNKERWAIYEVNGLKIEE